MLAFFSGMLFTIILVILTSLNVAPVQSLNAAEAEHSLEAMNFVLYTNAAAEYGRRNPGNLDAWSIEDLFPENVYGSDVEDAFQYKCITYEGKCRWQNIYEPGDKFRFVYAMPPFPKHFIKEVSRVTRGHVSYGIKTPNGELNNGTATTAMVKVPNSIPTGSMVYFFRQDPR